jgi:two-component system, chemotaxis family, chemotaxis protein CheY
MKKILVIEDDDALSWVISRILSSRYEIKVIKNGLEAMAWLTNGNVPEVIISDLHMPQLNGMELLQFLQHSGIYKEIPVIILSGDESPEIKTRCLELGAVKFILKPFGPEQLINEVEHALKLKSVIKTNKE